MFGLGFGELALILLVAFLVLGPKKLPELARSLGKGLRELRRASEDLRSSIREPLEEVRKPLEDLRDQLADTVYTVGREIEREAREGEPSDDAPREEGNGTKIAAPGTDTLPGVEMEDRRREVEELYAAAAREEVTAGEPLGEPPRHPPGEPTQAGQPDVVRPADRDVAGTPKAEIPPPGIKP
jgi:Tat protein translocase TatB subunit